MAEVKEVKVPDIGDFSDVPVIEILVSKGDEVSEEDPLVTLESDKASMDVPAPFAGTIEEIVVSEGDTVSEGSVIMKVAVGGDGGDSSDEDTSAEDADDEDTSEEDTSDEDEDTAEEDTSADEDGSAGGEESAKEAPSGPSGSAGADSSADGGSSSADGDGLVYASPSVRRLAREMSVDLSGVQGSGRKGRITKDDVEKAKEGGGAGPPSDTGGGTPVGDTAAEEGLGLAPWPSLDFSKQGETERVELTRIQKISGPNLARNWVRIPHVTHNDDADVTDLEAFRKQLNSEQSDVKVTMVALLIKASVATLKAHPKFNASLDGDAVIVKKYWNIGFAADTPQGLVVPVIKGADQKGLLEIAGELTELSGAAREGKLKMGDMQGATFTISSLGGIGGTSFTPIINAPEVAILGAVRSAMKPVWDGEQFVPRLMLPLSLSYDHRVIDGAAAARFTTHLVQVLQDMRRVLL